MQHVRSCLRQSANTGQHLAHLLTSGYQHLVEASFEQLMQQLPPPPEVPADSSAADVHADLDVRLAFLKAGGRLHAAEELLYVRCVASCSFSRSSICSCAWARSTSLFAHAAGGLLCAGACISWQTVASNW